MRYPFLKLREIKRWWQRHTRGYADIDWQNADDAIAAYAVKVLTHLRDHGKSFPGMYQNEASWKADLDLMIEAFLISRVDQFADNPGTPEHDIMVMGLHLFAKEFKNLWS